MTELDEWDKTTMVECTHPVNREVHETHRWTLDGVKNRCPGRVECRLTGCTVTLRDAVPGVDRSLRGPHNWQFCTREHRDAFERGQTIADVPRYMPIAEFQSLGFLQEVNRLVLHPAGLALEITIDPARPDDAHISGVWDYRDDPEGVAFVVDTIDTGKIEQVAAEQARHRDARSVLFTGRHSRITTHQPARVQGPDEYPLDLLAEPPT